MATRYDTQHDEGNSATQSALKKRRVYENIRPEEVKYGIAAANLSWFNQCPNRCLCKVAITDQHGNVLGHVSSYVDKLRSMKSTDNCRLCIRGLLSSATSGPGPKAASAEGANFVC